MRQFGLIACIFAAHHLSSIPPLGPGVPTSDQHLLETAEDHLRHHLLRSTPQVKKTLALLLDYQLHSSVNIRKLSWISQVLEWAKSGASPSTLQDLVHLVRDEEQTDISILVSEATEPHGLVQFRQEKDIVVDLLRLNWMYNVESIIDALTYKPSALV